MYLFLSAPPFIFRRTSFNPWVRASSSPGRNDRTTLPTTNRNFNIFTVITSLRYPPPLNLIPTTRHCCIVLLKALFSLDAAVTRAVDVEESQYMCLSSRQARCTVKPPWSAGNSQIINKNVQTDKLTLVRVELVSPGPWFAARGFSRRLNHLS